MKSKNMLFDKIKYFHFFLFFFFNILNVVNVNQLFINGRVIKRINIGHQF